ncbi:Enoyl-CoA hydratase/isomerase [Dillenia turbinata]|uniref:Enoyl-CoA hydratase/isomerase n=1 Tax=Dillenia turbinata TaxID=194707 RepID=A0AAN8USL7_9MAGN
MEEKYKTLEIERLSSTSSVYCLCLNTPSLKNALTLDFFTEFPKAISSLDQNPNVSVIIISSKTQHFCSGIHIQALSTITNQHQVSDRGRTGERLRRTIKSMQDSLTAIERCRKPVIAAINGGCIGGGIDLVTACDVRYCSKDAFFSVKEVDLAIVADLGTLQRLPRIVGFGNAMELALTGRRFSGEEAKNIGLVTKVFESKVELDDGVRQIAENIAAKSPLAVVGTKAVLLKSRDMSTDQGLDYIATWNSSMLLSDDLMEAVQAHLKKRTPVFSKL